VGLKLVSLEDFREEISRRKRKASLHQCFGHHPLSGFWCNTWGTRNHPRGSG
jgi:hypothetical protein